MSKQGKMRTMSICLTDLKNNPKYLTKAGNGKIYVSLTTWDNDQPDKFGNDFSVTISKTKEEREAIKDGQKIPNIYVGNGIIWEPTTQQADPEAVDDLPF